MHGHRFFLMLGLLAVIGGMRPAGVIIMSVSSGLIMLLFFILDWARNV